ncbi:MAG: phosphatidylserine decarboxylase [bacterium]
MKIRSESFPWISVSGLLAVVSYAVWIYTGSLIVEILFALFTALAIFFVYFFRDPERTPNSEEDTDWVSPADGVVTGIETLPDGRKKIVIFLTVFNVHVNRMPVDGTVREIDYREGQFLPAYKGELDEKNEQNRVICEDSLERPFEVWPIAGQFARRIHCWTDVSNPFKRGDRFGMISLGSRTDLLLPKGVDPCVKPKETVRGGQTIVARG